LSPLVSPAGQAITVQQAERLQAPQQDVELAKKSAPVEQRPDPATTADVDSLRNAIHLSSANVDVHDRDWNGPPVVHDDRDNRVWDQNVRQWDRNWVQYDDYYRPTLFNPYHDTVKIIYVYENQPPPTVSRRSSSTPSKPSSTSQWVRSSAVTTRVRTCRMWRLRRHLRRC
jgi:hypothetical protein